MTVPRTSFLNLIFLITLKALLLHALLFLRGGDLLSAFLLLEMAYLLGTFIKRKRQEVRSKVAGVLFIWRAPAYFVPDEVLGRYLLQVLTDYESKTGLRAHGLQEGMTVLVEPRIPYDPDWEGGTSDVVLLDPDLRLARIWAPALLDAEGLREAMLQVLCHIHFPYRPEIDDADWLQSKGLKVL